MGSQIMKPIKQDQNDNVQSYLQYLYYIYYYKLFRNSMRARSGAYHADSEQSFIDLVLASENTQGLFYNNRVNSKVMKKLNSKKESTPHRSTHLPKAPSFQRQAEKSSFSGFDFSLEIQVDKQEREQLERMRSSPLKQINVGILTNRSHQVLQDLSQVLGVPAEEQQLSRGVNLVIATRGQTICKYWIFQKEFLNTKDELISLYLDHCSQLYGIDQADHDLNVVRQGKKGEESWIKENIQTILI